MNNEKEFKELPEGWKKVKLGEVSFLNYGKNLPKDKFIEDGKYKVYGANGIIGFYNRYTHCETTVLVSCRGEYSGVINLAEPYSFITNNSIPLTIKDKKKLYPKFLYYFLKISPREKIVSGSAQPQVVINDLKNIDILNPPLPEQQKIAEILETVDNAIEKTDRIIEKYKRIKQGLMHDLLTKGIDENGNIRSEETHKFKDSPLGRIPEEWEVVRLGEVAFITKLAGFEYTEFFDYSLEGEIILIRALNIKDGKLDLTNIYTMPKKISLKLGRSKLKKGDIVMSYVGTIGECAIIPSNNKFHLAPNVAKISVRSKNVLSEYILYYLLGILGKKEIKIVISSTTQDALSMSNIRTIRLLLPSLPEQQRIAEILSQLDQTIEKEEQYKEKLERIKQGLMEDLLTGKVRVKNIIEED